MDNEPYSSHLMPHDALPPVPRGEPPPSTGMPQSADARDLPDLNILPEVQEITEETSSSTSSSRLSPPDKALLRTRVLNPKPFSAGRIARAFEGMRRFYVRMRTRINRLKEKAGMSRRKSTKRGPPLMSEDIWRRTKRQPGDDLEKRKRLKSSVTV